ncbi:MAG: deoxyhypusine synthase family protein, partial [Planctomycetota bacterium]
MPDDSPISRFMETHFKHFNAAALVDAARAYRDHVDAGGKMLVAIAGAMSTAELGISLAEMIRRDKVHFVSCTGANLEEDLFNLVAHEHYERVPDYRDLTPGQEKELLDRGMNRVTDTCIPEEEAMRVLDKAVLDRWMAADRAGERKLPHEFVYEIIRDG